MTRRSAAARHGQPPRANGLELRAARVRCLRQRPARRPRSRCRRRPGSSAPKTAEPATNSPAPASATLPAVPGSMPPSTSIVPSPTSGASLPDLVGRVGDEGLASPAGVDGHAEEDVGVVDRLADRADRRAGVDREAGEAAELADRVQGAVDVRGRLGVEGDASPRPPWRTPRSGARGARSSGGRRSRRRPGGPGRRSSSATRGPIVIGGTKWPSITSTWMIRAPAAITSSTCAPSREKSAERIEGATRLRAKRSRARGRGVIGGGFHPLPQMLAEHRVAAVLAHHVLGAAHAADRLVLAAVRALGDELEAAQAVDADEAPGQLRGAQPGLAAARAIRALQRALARHPEPRPISQAAIGSFGHVTRVASGQAARCRRSR